MGDTLRVATLPESHGANRSQGSDCQPGVVADFGRSCLPGSTSRLAATSVHVNRQYRLAVSLERRTRFACGESPFRQKGPTLTTIRDYTHCQPGCFRMRSIRMGPSTRISLMFVGVVVFVLSFVVMFDLSGVGFSVDRHNEFRRGIRSVQIACQFFILQGKA